MLFNKKLFRVVFLFVIIVIIMSIIKGFVKNIDGKENYKSMNIEDKASADTPRETLETLVAETKHLKLSSKSLENENKILREENKNILKNLYQKIREKIISEFKYNNQTINNKIFELETKIVGINNKRQTNMDRKTIGKIYDLSEKDNPELPFINKESSLEKEKIPYSTMAENSTLTNVKLMSSLVGRIPIKGKVIDPYLFKIIIGNENLAANGIKIPNIKGMVASGYAEGDMTLSCVRGWINSMTFVFKDGTIDTVSTQNNSKTFKKEQSLGWLSDPFGNPCIPGKFYSNAPKLVARHVLLSGAEGATQAFSRTQMTNTTTPLGGAMQNLTGSQGQYLLGQAAANALAESKNWWEERSNQSFDAIYISAGKAVVLNISKPIEINYNKKGRRVNYENEIQNNAIIDSDLD